MEDQISPASQTVPSSSLPPVRDLLNQSWDTFLKSLLNLFILWIINIVAWIVLFVILVILGSLLFGVSTNFIPLLFSKGFQAAFLSLAKTPAPALIILSVLFILYIVGAIVISLVISAANILVIDGEGSSVSFSSTFSKSFKVSLPLLAAGLLSSLLFIGGFFLFVIPGILFAYLLFFVSYEVVLGGQGPIASLKRSLLIISRRFGEIFIRLLLLLGISIVFSMVFQAFRFVPSLLFSIIVPYILVSFFFGLFSLSYVITLYKQARIGFEGEKGSGLLWIVVVAVIGWVIAFIMFFLFYKLAFPQIRKSLNTRSQPVAQKLTQLQANELAGETFLAIDLYRENHKLQPLQENETLCGYAQRRLDQLTKLGRLDNYKGFYEDLANPQISKTYFAQYPIVAEDDGYINFLTKPEDVINYFISSKNETAISGSNKTGSCVLATPDFLVIVSGGSNSRSNNL